MSNNSPQKTEPVILSISQCVDCPNNAPFFFDINGQKAMIITATGNLQTNYFPLISVRFVRNLLYSLFGKSGLTEDGFRKLFESDGIYWTSFHKCYDRHMLRKIDGNYAMDQFSHTRCGEKFLQREIDALNPELLIVMGQATCNAVQNMVTDGRLRLPSNCIFTDYLHKEQDTNKFEEIRIALAKTLNITNDSEPIDAAITKTTNTDAEVHYQFQLCTAQALRKAHEGNSGKFLIPPYENEVERLWIEQVTVPIIKRYHTLLNYWSSIESSLLSFICKANERYEESNIGTTAGKYNTKNSDILLEKMDEMSDSLISKIDTHFRCRIGSQLLHEWRILKTRLNVIKTIRNAIIHSSGFIPFRTVYHHYDMPRYRYNININAKLLSSGFSGITVIPNMVYVKEQGLDEMDVLYQQLTEFLIRADIS